MVGAHESAQPGRLELALERLAQGLTSIRVAAAAFVARFTDISAYKDVMGKCRHIRPARSTKGVTRVQADCLLWYQTSILRLHLQPDDVLERAPQHRQATRPE